jgi:hypothetical protein
VPGNRLFIVQRREVRSAKSRKVQKMISEEDIRRRAFEISQENGITSNNELEDWVRAESELRGYNR